MTPIPTPSPDTMRFINLILSSTADSPNSVEEFREYISKDSEQSVITDSKNLSLKEMEALAKTRANKRIADVRNELDHYSDLLSTRVRKVKAE